MFKRKFSEFQSNEYVSDNTRSKKKMKRENNFNGYVSGSQVINWFMDDCLVDWIKLKEILEGKEMQTEKEDNYLADQGHLFEKGVVDYINQEIYPTVYIGDSRGWNESLVLKTLEEMKKGTPFIYSAALQNKNLKVYGTADLLVRNDYLSKLFLDLPEQIKNDNFFTKFNHPYYYVIVDIKWCTLNLKKDGKEISDTKRFPGYKGQLLIYSMCLEEMQGYFPKTAYLLGRRCVWSEGETKSPFTRPGIFYTEDKEIKNKTDQAIGWIRDLNKEGMNWTCNPPSRPELYPNLGSRYYLPFKKDLAEKIGDLSLLCNIKSERKKKAFSEGIYNIHDPRLNSKILNIGGKDGRIMDKILEINKSKNSFMLPSKIEGNEGRWRENNEECFVDFETFGDLMDDCKDVSNHKSREMVFLIGVGFEEKGKFIYKHFVAKEISQEGEKKVLEQFLDFMVYKGFRRAWYYYAEKIFWRKLVNKYKLRDTSSIFEWKDLHQFIYQNEIVFKGSFDFKLKNIIKAFIKEGIFNKPNESECSNGWNAMVQGIDFYQTKEEEKIKGIIIYNKLDVTYLFQLISYFRENL